MLDKFFYVICRDGQIMEIFRSEDTFKAVFGAMLNKGVVMLKEYGTVLNGVDISKVLTMEQYDSFVDSAQPKLFIKNGIWYDIKDKTKAIRYEKWREKELEDKRKIQLQEPEQISNLELMEIIKKNRPSWYKEVEKVTNKMRML